MTAQSLTKLWCTVVLAMGATAVATTEVQAVQRFNVTLDGGTQSVTVDNASSWSNAFVGPRVLAADRSTVDDCDYTQPDYKGLIRTGDRVLVTDNYIAWFDMTLQDGITFGSPYPSQWPRSGALAGFWTLDPNTIDAALRWPVLGPHNCLDWGPNELVPGSASPNREQHFWDKHGPGLEHALQVVAGSQKYVFGHHFSQAASQGQWSLDVDGQVDGSGAVHYKASGRMASLNNFSVDVTDSNNGNGIQNYIRSEVEYVGRDDRLEVIWKIKPQNSNVVTDNVFIYAWLTYAQDMDGTACDIASGSQWPSTIWRNYEYSKSNMSLKRNWATGTFGPGQVVQLQWGPTCSNPYVNYAIRTTPDFGVTDGSWLAVGDGSAVGPSQARLLWKNRDVPGTGTGSYSNPIKVDWHRLIFWNETHDGTVGMGLTRGPFSDPADYLTLIAGKWYQARFEFTSTW